MKKRVFLIVLDSLGIGGAPDAAEYFNDGKSDQGANTVLHIVEAMRARGGVSWPNLRKLGLGQALSASVGICPPEFEGAQIGTGGAAREHSHGKDTPSGHWEMAGAPVPWDWHYFPSTIPAFPPSLTDEIFDKTGMTFLGNKHASGTAIIEEFGEEHIRTGKPIAYTSVDSVFQIAAHEKYFGLKRLYTLCEAVAEIVHPMKVGRVIARPFIGEVSDFERTPNRHDYAIEPPNLTILDRAQKAGRPTVAIGKIRDIFSGRGIDEAFAGKSDDGLFDDLETQLHKAPSGTLCFANFVEFDSQYGHRRDIAGYARHVDWFDQRLGVFLDALRPEDMVIVTADHGNDPSWYGTDHTREQVPFLIYAPSLEIKPFGQVDFVDIGATVLDYLDVPSGSCGKTVLT